ncbi:MJ1477/TM1410 family putative glycoside hydrolase [Jannaschia ovalis]|uniref:Endo alpha-1,4 polygalactosaminidase n=1 Tax=Jannaschia ovalis TaxID=3038773 RepID=A0ABY8LEZ0_9RHOB|nr:MJ1477/TM1410 family putative glycoside hydrolase [Jannaschia sp. GRR-S6-38]WGH78734.1 endo alpha-1,4 polygalactosaminidase [Jannaschia sp. GRR-S6-38]
MLLAASFFFVICAACVQSPSASPIPDAQSARNSSGSASPASPSLRFEIRQFSVKLTHTGVSEVDRSDTDFVIIDPTGLDRQEVARLKTRPDGARRVVVAYINIAEAETYRDYWRTAWNATPPRWLGAANPDWANHYYTAYWDPQWQRILFGSPASKLDRIVAAGFDGVFMDGVDKYAVWPGRRAQSERDMYTLVDRIANYARARTPGFLIIPNNAEALLDNPRYRSTIDAIVKEDLFFGVGGDGRPNSLSLVSWSLRQLRLATNDDLPVLVVEYVSDAGKRDYTVRQLRANGLLGTFGRRDLARLTLPIPAGAGSVNQLRRLPRMD